MKRFLIYCLFACLFSISGCVSAPTIVSVFDPDAAAFIHQSGNASIRGQAFLRRNDGIVVYAAGSETRLVPKTPYSVERMNAIYRDGKINSYIPSPPFPPGYQEATRVTKADGEGRFEFADVADGDYYLVAPVIWNVGNVPQGGSVMEQVTVKDGTDLNVIMSGS